jgi:hypothetical protein
MKRVAASIIICLALTGCSKQEPTGSWQRLSEWEAGFEGEMYVNDGEIYLTNGFLQGDQYQSYDLPDDAGSGRAVEFVTETLGYLGRLNGHYGLLKTVDKKTFKPVEALNGAKVCGISHVGKQFVIAVGPYNGGEETQEKRVRISRDGGVTWDHPDVSGLITGATDVHCSSDKKCVIAGKNANNKGALFLTADGGRSWEQVHEDDVGYGWKLQFLDELTGFASMWPNAIAKTVDGGLSWERIKIEGTEGVEGIGFINQSLGFISGKDTLVTTDGGKTWHNSSLSGKVDKFFLANGVMYAKVGYVMRYEQGNGVEQDEGGLTKSVPHSSIDHTFDQGRLTVSLDMAELSPTRFLFMDESGSSIKMEPGPSVSGQRDIVVSKTYNAKKLLVLTDPELHIINLGTL